MIDRFTLVGTLRATPDLVTTVDGVPCCRLQLVVRNHCKDRDSGLWGEHSRCFTVAVIGSAARRCIIDLAGGDLISVRGRLHWPQHGESDSQPNTARLLITEHAPTRVAGMRCATSGHTTGVSAAPGSGE